MQWIIGIILVISAISIFGSAIAKGELWAIIVVVVIPVLIVLAYYVNKNDVNIAKGRKKDFINKVNDIIDNHIEILSGKKAKCTTVDDYGHVQFNEKKWDKDILYFMENVVMKEIRANKGAVEFELNATELINDRIQKYLYSKESNV